MSNDLISRKVVMEYLQEQQANVIIEKNKNNPVTYDATKGMAASVNAFINFIVQMPTAYDVDKVVEALEIKSIPCNEKGKCIWTEENQLGCEECVKRKAVEIVKGGGVDEAN